SPEEKDPGSVRSGNNEPEEQRVARRASGPNQVGCDQGLPVARLQGMEGPQSQRNRQGRQNHPEAQLVRGDQFRKGVSGRGLLVGLQPEWLESRQGLSPGLPSDLRGWQSDSQRSGSVSGLFAV